MKISFPLPLPTYVIMTHRKGPDLADIFLDYDFLVGIKFPTALFIVQSRFLNITMDKT